MQLVLLHKMFWKTEEVGPHRLQQTEALRSCTGLNTLLYKFQEFWSSQLNGDFFYRTLKMVQCQDLFGFLSAAFKDSPFCVHIRTEGIFQYFIKSFLVYNCRILLCNICYTSESCQSLKKPLYLLFTATCIFLSL